MNHAPTTRITGIDTHAHIFHPALPMVAGRRYAPDYTASVEDYLLHLDQAGLSHGVLIQPSFLGTDNSHIEEALIAHPDRLRAIAVVDHTIDDRELDRLSALGFVGARLNLIGKDADHYNAPDWQMFFRRLAARNWQVEIQRHFQDLHAIIPAIAEAGVSLMIDHFGLPQGGIDPDNNAHAAFLQLLVANPNIWIKLSAPYRAAMTIDLASRSLTLLKESCGMNRFVWGSDWPHTQHEQETTYAEQLAFLRKLLPEHADQQKVLIDNPAALFHFIS